MGRYEGMMGVKGPLEGPFVGSKTAVIKDIREHRICSVVGDHGSVLVWRDDQGQLRACYDHYHREIAGGEFKSQSDLKAWLAEWMPKVHLQPE